jgi:hypothetical protein
MYSFYSCIYPNDCLTQGSSGSQGSQGETGATGSQGPQGATGPAGATGATGPAGATGATGSVGTNGATEPSGSPGSAGKDGTATRYTIEGSFDVTQDGDLIKYETIVRLTMPVIGRRLKFLNLRYRICLWYMFI